MCFLGKIILFVIDARFSRRQLRNGMRLVELLWQNVRNVVPWMTVQALLETLLVHVVTNEADTSSKHEQRVDRSDVNVFLSFLTIV